jgi:hypothetical protein
VMNYLFQIRGLIGTTGPAIDLSRQVLKLVKPGNGPQVLNDVDESNLTETALKQGNQAALYPTRWYAPLSGSYLDGWVGTTASTRHCDGTPLHNDASKPDYNPADVTAMVRVDGSYPIGAIDWNANGTVGDGSVVPFAQDVNFSGSTGDAAKDGVFTGWNDWEHLDLRQTASRRNPASLSLEITVEDLASAADGDPGYGDPGYGDPGYGDPGYGDPGYGDPGYGDPGYGDPGYGDPGYGDPGYGDPGYGDPGYGGELDVPGAESQGPTPNSLSFVLTNKSIDLKWTKPNVGKVDKYYVWRAVGTISPSNKPSNITPAGVAPGVTPCNAVSGALYCDTSSKNNVTYQYLVTATFVNGNKSGASNIVTAKR